VKNSTGTSQFSFPSGVNAWLISYYLVSSSITNTSDGVSIFRGTGLEPYFDPELVPNCTITLSRVTAKAAIRVTGYQLMSVTDPSKPCHMLAFAAETLSDNTICEFLATPLNYLSTASQLVKLNKMQTRMHEMQCALSSIQNAVKSETNSSKKQSRALFDFSSQQEEKYPNESQIRNERVVRMAVGSDDVKDKVSQSPESTLGLANALTEEEEVEELKREAHQHGYVILRRDSRISASEKRSSERQQGASLLDDLGATQPAVLRRTDTELGGRRASSLK